MIRLLAFLVVAVHLAGAGLKDFPQYIATGSDWKSGIAALPEADHAAWQAYLDKSAALQQLQRDALAAELKTTGLTKPLPAPEGGSFKWEKGKDAAGAVSVDVLLTWQLPSGGWSKAVDYRKGPRQAGMQWTSQTDPWHYAATLDNRSTTDQLRMLAALHQTAPSAPVAQSIQRGVAWLLAAQFPSGGWPQVFPLEGGYHDNITLNDDAMMHAIEVLTLVRESAEGFDCVDAGTRAASGNAVERGIRCLIACQQKRDGKPTAWCAQHDPVTLKPAGGRAYEPASLSGGESCEVVRFLMTLPHPDAGVVAAIEGALVWFASVQLPGEKPGDPPRWARFYDLQTHTPVFGGKKDHKIYTDYAAMRANNPGGYDYFTTKPADLIGKWADRWRKKLK